MKKQRQLRVKSYTRRVPAERGYIGEDVIHIQKLEEKRWHGWVAIDEEEVPAHVKIAIGALGSDSWKSKFGVHGTFGRDGIITPWPQTQPSPT